MKPILKQKKKLPLSIKLTAFFLLVIISVFVIININHKEVDQTANELIADLQLLPPQCTDNGGFYKESLSITLIPSPATKIYYTLDGSEPTTESTIYTEPIRIKNQTEEPNNFSNIPTSPRWQPPLETVFKGTVIRAISVIDNKKSKELVRTFFIDEKGNQKYTLPVIALTVNKEDLFGYKNGIYVLGKNYEDKRDYIKKNISFELPWWSYPANYLKRGINAERPVYIEFFEPESKNSFAQNAGLRINGNATRGFAQKSLRIYFDDQYGNKPLNYMLFPDNGTTHYNSFILRNSGNDWNKTMFRDALMQSLMASSTLCVQAYRPGIVFINAEYWGIHNIRERFDENYLANKYKINKDSIVILELNGKLFYGKKKDENDFQQLLNFFKKNDLSLDSNYEYIKKRIDIENFMDHIIMNVYFCNSDWPGNNVKFWKTKTIIETPDSMQFKDGRWRWVLSDTDWGLGCTGADAVQLNLLEKATKVGSIGIIFRGLLKNEKFSEQFFSRFNYYIKNTFDSEYLILKIDKFQKTLAPEMTDHINRWRVIGSYQNWEDNVQELRNFALIRPAIQLDQLNRFMENYLNN